MDQSFQAIFEGGVLRPLEPLNLREHEVVSVSIVDAAALQAADTAGRMSADDKRAIVALLEQMERVPRKSPSDGVSQRDHDQMIYGLAK